MSMQSSSPGTDTLEHHGILRPSLAGPSVSVRKVSPALEARQQVD